jgi:hypothetical protein
LRSDESASVLRESQLERGTPFSTSENCREEDRDVQSPL